MNEIEQKYQEAVKFALAGARLLSQLLENKSLTVEQKGIQKRAQDQVRAAERMLQEIKFTG